MAVYKIRETFLMLCKVLQVSQDGTSKNFSLGTSINCSVVGVFSVNVVALAGLLRITERIFF
jgi:hypothetical protein